MGSEQSQQPAATRPTRAHITRGHTIATSHVTDYPQSLEVASSGNNSPGASVCSDSELPYISYTVNRPIGDSPKMTHKSSGSSQTHIRQNSESSNSKKSSGISLLQRKQLSLQGGSSRSKANKVHNIVVVKEGKAEPSLDTDEDVTRLQQIPMFLPIMRGTLGLPGARDPEVLEGLEWRAWLRLASRYQAHLAACAQPVAATQSGLTQKVKETDAEISRLMAAMKERQRQNARNAERLSRVHELSHQLTRCHSLLHQAIETMDTLNHLLPPSERLEKFTWP